MRWIITGPESTGKTSLSETLAEKVDMELIPEYARSYMASLERPYEEKDLDHIAKRQIQEWKGTHHLPIIFDTDILTTILWYQEKYRKIPNFMLEHWLSQQGAIYLLCDADLPWEEDPMRENPNDRDRLFQIYFHFLNAYGKPFKVISGHGIERINTAIAFIKKLEHK